MSSLFGQFLDFPFSGCEFVGGGRKLCGFLCGEALRFSNSGFQFRALLL